MTWGFFIFLGGGELKYPNGKKPLQKSIVLVFINQACNIWKGVSHHSTTGTCGFKHDKSEIQAILTNHTNNGEVGT